jgi:hypothetical protein
MSYDPLQAAPDELDLIEKMQLDHNRRKQRLIQLVQTYQDGAVPPSQERSGKSKSPRGAAQRVLSRNVRIVIVSHYIFLPPSPLISTFCAFTLEPLQFNFSF